METVLAAWRDLAFTESHIRQLHRDLLIYSKKDAWRRGSYKTTPNGVAAFDADGKQVGIDRVKTQQGNRARGPVPEL